VRSFWDHWYSSWLWSLWSLVSGAPSPHPPVWKWMSNTQENWDRRLDEYYCQGSEVPPEPQDNYALTTTSSPASGALPLNSGSGSMNLPVTPPSVSIGPDPRSGGGGGGDSAAIGTVNSGGGGYSASPGYSGTGGAGSTMSGYGTGGTGGSGYSGAYGTSGFTNPIPSVFVSNDSEALTYFQIALAMGHPLANAYTTAQRNTIKYYNPDAARIIADAEKRARFWSPPFEYYPGATAGGMPHSDESQPTLEQRIALSRIRELPLNAVIEALDFRGYAKRGPRCGPPPICFRRGVMQFQNAMGFEPTGILTPPQTVRLIQMAAVDGDAIAQDRLGIMYAKGIGVPQNFVRAEKWFIKSANQRFPDALYNLYVLYKVGPNGIEPDEHKAVSFSAQAMAAGYNRTLCELLDLLDQADGGRDHPVGARR
jgi:TPR repeat protein